MALTLKILATGQLPNGKGTLYTVPGATTAVVVLITVVNSTGAAAVVNLYTKKSAGSSRYLSEPGLAVDKAYDRRGPLTLGAADQIEGDDGGAGGAVFDYTIFGLERT